MLSKTRVYEESFGVGSCAGLGFSGPDHLALVAACRHPGGSSRAGVLEVPAEWTPEGPLALKQAIGLALLRQPDMLSARAQVRQADGATTQLRSQLLPQIGGAGVYIARPPPPRPWPGRPF